MIYAEIFCWMQLPSPRYLQGLSPRPNATMSCLSRLLTQLSQPASQHPAFLGSPPAPCLLSPPHSQGPAHTHWSTAFPLEVAFIWMEASEWLLEREGLGAGMPGGHPLLICTFPPLRPNRDTRSARTAPGPLGAQVRWGLRKVKCSQSFHHCPWFPACEASGFKG